MSRDHWPLHSAWLFVLCSICAAASDQMLPNPSFEGDYVNGLAPGWAIGSHWGERGVAVGKETDAAHSGHAAQKIVCAEFHAGRVMLVASGAAVSLCAGANYEATAWVRADRAMGTVELLALELGEKGPRILASHVGRAGRDWQPRLMRFQASRRVARVALAVSFAQEGVLWVDDASLRVWPGPSQDTERQPGNLVPNGSFEQGLRAWLVTGRAEADVGARSLDGHASLRVTCGTGEGEVRSCPISLTPCREHVLSLSLFADPPRTHVRVGIVPAGPDQDIAPIEKVVKVGQPWQRFVVKAGLPAVPDGRYCVRILPGPGEGQLWVDAVQVEEDSAASPFKPHAELRVVLAAQGRKPVFRQGAALSLTAACYNNALRILELSMQVAVTDPLGRRIPQPVLRVDAMPGLVRKSFRVATNDAVGTFLVRVEDPSPRDIFAPATLRVVVLPSGVASRPRAQAAYGYQWDAPDWAPELAGRERPAWARTEGGPGPAAACTVLATVGSAACWAKDLSRASGRAGLQRYVAALASRHRGRVAAWEFALEADLDRHTVAAQPSAAQCAALARAGYAAVKKADPAAAVAVTCPSPSAPAGRGLRALMERGAAQWLDAVTVVHRSSDEWTHMRRVEQVRRELAHVAGSVPIWASRCAPASGPLVTHPGRPRPLLGTADTLEERVSAMVRGMVTRRAAGAERCYLAQAGWDSACRAPAHRISAERLAWRRHMQPALAVAASLLDAAVYVRPLEVENVLAFAFRRGTAKLVVLWARADAAPQVQVTLKVDGPTRVLDLVGNEMDHRDRPGGLRLAVGRRPVYVLVGRNAAAGGL